VLVSLRRSVLLPVHLWQEYRSSKRRGNVLARSEFDRAHDVDTDGDVNGWTQLSDLEIPGANWIYGRNYAPIEPERFHTILSGLQIRYEEFTFVDFGSGKGRALLLASEYPFQRVVGMEFSPQLHRIAQENIRRVAGHQKSGPVESVCADFLDFPLPSTPAVFFFFDPCDDPVLKQLLHKIRESLELGPRTVYLIYVAPTKSKRFLLDATPWLVKITENTDRNYRVYRSR
jgi:SAM-dependent methyltransferase